MDASQHVFRSRPGRDARVAGVRATVDGGDLVPDYPVTLARAGKTHPVPLLIGTNKNEAALFRLMRSPLMPIAPKAVRTMFSEMANDQPGLQLPTAEQVSSAYPAKMARTRSLWVASDVGFRMPTVWFAEGHTAVAPVYLYRFDWATPLFQDDPIGCRTRHRADLCVGGQPDLGSPRRHVQARRTQDRRGTVRADARPLDAFAATGDPNVPLGQPHWARIGTATARRW